MKLRLDGYDAPEMKPKLDIEDRNLHIEAAQKSKEVLQKLLQPNKLYWVYIKSYEKYGRLLGSLYNINESPHTDKSINNIMITNGFGKVYKGKTKEEFSKIDLIRIKNSSFMQT
jgi:endonuclease YncB( thermonuclease family)